jgi:hypothetical protein
MEAQLREVIGDELRKRNGYGAMTIKIKPVHIANALLRTEHQVSGRMGDLAYLFAATAARETADAKVEAARRMLERNIERWGRLGDERDLRRSVLVTRVLPLLRTILGADGAAFGKSPGLSSFSSPTALTVTLDPSDDHAGEFIHRLWSNPARLRILDILHGITDPDKDVATVDDITAVLIPLTDGVKPLSTDRKAYSPLTTEPSDVVVCLRQAAEDLARYEDALQPNPMATLQRIVLLGATSLFFHAATRRSECLGLPQRVMLLDASDSRASPVAAASEASVCAILRDAREHMVAILTNLLLTTSGGWRLDPEAALSEVFQARCKQRPKAVNLKGLIDAVDEIRDAEADIKSELPRRLVGLLDSGANFDGYIRLLGLRSGLLYPQQKNPNKRLVPMDRALEVLVASTVDLSGRPMEYRDFLDQFHQRWGIVVGGRLEDARLLAEARMAVPSADLTENSERFLTRLQGLGLARKMADSVAVVGLMESADDRT